MGERSPLDSALRQARIMHVVFTLTPLIYLNVLVVLSFYVGQLVDIGDALLVSLTVVLGLLSLLELASGYYVPRLAALAGIRGGRAPEKAIRGMLVSRPAFYAAPAIFGLFLDVLGASWLVVIPFLLASFVALLLSFPRAKHIERLMEEARG